MTCEGCICSSTVTFSYNTVDDLSDKINFFKKNEKSRIKIAKNGQKKYFKLFNEKKISKYIVEKSFGNNAKLF